MTEQNLFQEKILTKAVKDEAFRQELLSDPKAVVARELGLTLPGGVSIQVLENTSTTLYIVLPPRPEADETHELSDEELEAVAGGANQYIITTTLWCRLD